MADTKILTFDSVHHALRAEKILRQNGIPINVINTPRHISSDCGISLRFDGEWEEKIIKTLRVEEVEFKNIYSL